MMAPAYQSASSSSIIATRSVSHRWVLGSHLPDLYFFLLVFSFGFVGSSLSSGSWVVPFPSAMSVALSSLKHHVRHLTVETWTNHNFLFLIYFNLSVNKPISNTFGFFCKKIYLYPSYYTSISIPSCHVGTNGKAGVVYTLLSSAASWFLSWPTCIGKWMDTDLTFSEIQYSLTCD